METYKAKQCNNPNCNKTNLKKRKNPPKTASEHAKYFEYWQCPTCKVNVAYPLTNNTR
jgi:hypothetical protein